MFLIRATGRVATLAGARSEKAGARVARNRQQEDLGKVGPGFQSFSAAEVLSLSDVWGLALRFAGIDGCSQPIILCSR